MAVKMERERVTLSLKCPIFEIFNFKNAVTLKTCCDIEIGVRGHSRSLKEVPFYTPGIVSY